MVICADMEASPEVTMTAQARFALYGAFWLRVMFVNDGYVMVAGPGHADVITNNGAVDTDGVNSAVKPLETPLLSETKRRYKYPPLDSYLKRGAHRESHLVEIHNTIECRKA
jgi:hypothetical protein